MASPRAWLASLLPFTDLKGYGREAFVHDLSAALTVTFMSIPQGVAYAMIAGLPPAMGLYASCVPTIVGSLFRSSRHVIAGPTNALSLLVGTAGAAAADLDPIPTAMLLAFLVGITQTLAGVLRLGVLVDYISTPVVIGYISGAGVLIGIGQLPNLTETAGAPGNLFQKVAGWSDGLGATNGWALALGVGVAIAIVAMRRIDRRIPGPILVLGLATLASWALDFEALGLRRIVDLAPVPAGLPPLTLPDGQSWSFEGWQALLPLAGAVAVLSLVESSAVARSIASRTGQRLEISTEFAGQGLANLACAFFGGFPISGSLSRSALNHQGRAETRMAGILNGAMMLGVLALLGPAVNYTPIAALAGLLVVVAVDLVDRKRITKILRARPSDAFAFGVTVLGTWILRLDHAIYVGVLVSIVLYLRRSRMLSIYHLVFDRDGRLSELSLDDPSGEELACSRIRIVNVEGQLFFGAASELGDALDELARRKSVKAVILRLRRARGLDLTTIAVLEAAAARLSAEGRHLFLVGMREKATSLLERTGTTEALGEDHVFPTTLTWFEASDAALTRALELIGEHDCHGPCPVARHLAADDFTPPAEGLFEVETMARDE